MGHGFQRLPSAFGVPLTSAHQTGQLLQNLCPWQDWPGERVDRAHQRPNSIKLLEDQKLLSTARLSHRCWGARGTKRPYRQSSWREMLTFQQPINWKLQLNSNVHEKVKGFSRVSCMLLKSTEKKCCQNRLHLRAIIGAIWIAFLWHRTVAQSRYKWHQHLPLRFTSLEWICSVPSCIYGPKDSKFKPLKYILRTSSYQVLLKIPAW